MYAMSALHELEWDISTVSAIFRKTINEETAYMAWQELQGEDRVIAHSIAQKFEAVCAKIDELHSELEDMGIEVDPESYIFR